MNNYPGWTNWMTHNIHLWIVSSGGRRREACEQAPFTPGEVRDFVYEMCPNGTPNMGSSLRFIDVDWEQLASALNGWSSPAVS